MEPMREASCLIWSHTHSDSDQMQYNRQTCLSGRGKVAAQGLVPWLFLLLEALGPHDPKA